MTPAKRTGYNAASEGGLVSIANMGGRTISVYRRTALMIDSRSTVGAPTAVVPDRQPTTGTLVEIEVSGAGTFGTLTVNGLVSGGPASEVLTFTAAGTQTTTTKFDSGSLTTIDEAGWSAGLTWEARSVGEDGSRNHIAYSVVTGVKCHLNRGAARWPNPVPGVNEVERTWFGIDYTTAWAPREGDVFVDEWSSEQWRVVGDPNWQGGRRPHHWEVRVVRREGSLTT